MIMLPATFSFRKLHVVVTTVVIITLTVFTLKHAAAQVTTLDFEDLNLGEIQTLPSAGVLFPEKAFVDTDVAARSGTRVLRADNPTDEHHQGRFAIEFTSQQVRVRLFAGGVAQQNDGTLRAFDSNGNLIDEDGPKPVAPNAFTTDFEVSAPTPSIVRIELEIAFTVIEAIDDLEFEGEAPAPVPTEPPVVQIISPTDGAQIDASSITVQGTVTGEGLFFPVSLKVEPGRPPDSLAPPSTGSVPLAGSGTSRTFAQPRLVGIGPHALTAEAQNTGGLTGSDAVAFVNLPQAIRERFAAEGGAATFGQLIYGAAAGGCRIAVYQEGAIAAVGGITFMVLGDVFNKWFSLRDQGAPIGRLGCPTGEERDAPGGARAQDFSKGRIYAQLPTGTHYVPAVFVDAIDQLGGEPATGVPIADPTDSPGAMQTWLFQQFTRPDHDKLLPSTLEIRGIPPVLWVERQGGDLSPPFQVFVSEGVPIFAETTPTIWQQFLCSGNLGPCDVDPPASNDPVENAGQLFCNGAIWPVVPAWVAIVDDYELTPILGIVSNVGLADIDNAYTHDFECQFPIIGLPDVTPFPEAPLVRSDYNVIVRPLHPFRDLFADNRETVELEFEICWFNRGFAAGMEPRLGDLLFASGRWVIDCGHPSDLIPPFSGYRSEIHPPAVLAPMRTVRLNGQPATRADIWVNGVYTGDPVEIDIFPPPRPSPDAILTVFQPATSQAAAGQISVDSSFASPTHVRVRFAASPKHVVVTLWGQMVWQNFREDAREYRGRWHLFWSE